MPVALTSPTSPSPQATLFKEMRGRIKEDDESVPVRRGDYYYYKKMQTGKQYGVRVRRRIRPERRGVYRPEDVPDDQTCEAEEVLLDENVEAEKSDGGFYVCGTFRPSPSHRCAGCSHAPASPGAFVSERGLTLRAPLPAVISQCARTARATSSTRCPFSTPRAQNRPALRKVSRPARAAWRGLATTRSST